MCQFLDIGVCLSWGSFPQWALLTFLMDNNTSLACELGWAWAPSHSSYIQNTSQASSFRPLLIPLLSDRKVVSVCSLILGLLLLLALPIFVYCESPIRITSPVKRRLHLPREFYIFPIYRNYPIIWNYSIHFGWINKCWKNKMSKMVSH